MYSSMRTSSQGMQFSMTRQSSRSVFPNMIKITPFGYQMLNNAQDWFSRTDQKINSPSLPSKIRLVVPDQVSNHPKKPEFKIVHYGRRQQSNRKVLRAYENWTKNQDLIHKNIEKQLNKRDLEKAKAFQWHEISIDYKNNIGGIFNQWAHQVNDQKSRVKERLNHIYKKKYLTNKQNTNERKKNLVKYIKYPVTPPESQG